MQYHTAKPSFFYRIDITQAAYAALKEIAFLLPDGEHP